MAKVLRGSERKEHGPPQATAGKSREGNGGTNRSGPSAASHAAVECPHRRQSASAGLNNPTSTCDSTNLTNILRSCCQSCQSAAFHHSAAASRPCTLYPVLAAAGLVIAAGSALPEHHHAALNRFPQAQGRRYSRPPRPLCCSTHQEADARHPLRPARHPGHHYSLAQDGFRRRLQQLAGERRGLHGRSG